MESGDSWASDFLLVLIEPEIVCSVRSKIELLSIQVVIVHIEYKLYLLSQKYIS